MNGNVGRTSLACSQCRQRKVKCSGGWPTCKACIRRSDKCQYPGVSPDDFSDTPATVAEALIDLPPKHILQEAVEIFLTLYGDFPFWFFRRHAFIEALSNDQIPHCILFSILSLVARFVEPCYHLYGGTIEASVHFASRARALVSDMFDEISLVHVHCNLMLGMYNLGHGNEHRAWLLIGSASLICQALGLRYESSYAADDNITAETKRRTFWSCFCLERLLVNGRDRPLTLAGSPITAYLPTSLDDFTVGRSSSALTLGGSNSSSDSLPGVLIRIVDLLGRIAGWGAAGIGGRHLDPRSPWVEDMPFSRLQAELQEWNDTLPPYLTFTETNIKSHHAGREGKLFGNIHLFYMTAGTRLHRKYLPFIPPPLFDPAEGPCDGPEIIADLNAPGFWAESTRKGIQFANGITEAFMMLERHKSDPWSTPLSGFSLLASTSFHVFCFLGRWQSCEKFVGEPAKPLLKYNLQSFIKMQENWPVAAFWVKSIRLFYESVSIAQSAAAVPHSPDRPQSTTIKEAMLQFDRSDREQEGLPAHIPSPEHDMFILLGDDLSID